MTPEENKLGKSLFLASRAVYMSIEQTVIVLLNYATLSTFPGDLGHEKMLSIRRIYDHKKAFYSRLRTPRR